MTMSGGEELKAKMIELKGRMVEAAASMINNGASANSLESRAAGFKTIYRAIREVVEESTLPESEADKKG